MTELGRLSRRDRENRLEDLATNLDRLPNGEVADVDRQIASFEATFGFDSVVLRERLAAGMPETWEVCQWLMLLDLKAHLAAVTARPR